MLDIHQDQLLMLLLVMQTEGDQRRHVAPHSLPRTFDQPQHRRRDMAPIGADRVNRRARQQTPFGARVTRADRLVIGVEQIGEGRIEHPIVGVERL